MIVGAYLKRLYDASHWHYRNLNRMYYDLRNEAIKEDITSELRELRKSGHVDVVAGCNGWLVKIINLK